MKNQKRPSSLRPKQQKVSLQVLAESYERLGNIWKVAQEVGICGQSVWERLKKHGIIKRKNYFTKEDDKKIIEAYTANMQCGDKKTDYLVKELKKNRHQISRRARAFKLTCRFRKKSPLLLEKFSANHKEWHKNNPHPRGMKGKKHSKEYCEQISTRVKKWFKDAPKETMRIRNTKMLQTKLAKYGTLCPMGENDTRSWKSGWREIGDAKKFYRSSWEANYARYLQWQKESGLIKEWKHELKTFWFEKIKRGSITYLPDFYVECLDGSHFWVEVKGWMDARSKTKIKRFKKYYPEENLILIDAKWFKKCAPKIRILIKEWE